MAGNLNILGNKWAILGRLLPNRTQEEIILRYHQHVEAADLRKKNWKREEYIQRGRMVEERIFKNDNWWL